MTAIQADAATDDTELDYNEDSAAEELLKRFLPPKDAEKPSKGKEDNDKDEPTPTPDDDAKDPAEKPEDEAPEEDEGTDEEEEEAEAGEVTIKVKVGDKEEDVPASKLARLYGQEKALTQKSMEVAEQRKTAEKDLATNAAATQALLARAKERFTPYAKLDFNLLAAQVGREGGLTTEEYQGLRQGAQAAYEDVQFLEKHLNDFMGAMRERQQNTVREQAVECLKVLSGPADKGGIEGWNEKLYGDLRSFATSQGAPADVINALVEPWAFKMIHAAMLYTRGKDKGKIVTVKANKTPKKIMKTTENTQAARSDGKNANAKKAMDRLRQHGTPDDAAEALLAHWTQKRSEAADE